MAPATEAATLTATVTLPSTVDFASATAPATYDSGTRVIDFNANTLGFTFAGTQRPVVFHVTVAAGDAVGTSVALSADIQAVGETDGVTVHQQESSAALVVAPPPATLADSTVSCADVNGGTLLPGDQVSCTVEISNTADHEDATLVTANLTLSGAIWLTGGTSFSVASTRFDTTDLGDVAAGTTKSASATFQVPAAALGGDVLGAFAFISGSSTPSSTGILLSKGASPLVVSPGPAVLTGSSLLCADTNGGVLLGGDDLTCTVTVRPASGHEDVQGSSASIAIPAGAEYLSGGDSHDASSVSFDPASLGDVAAGDAKSATFHLRVASATWPGSTLQPTGSIAATSVPLGGAVAQALTGNVLTVGQVVVLPGDTPPPDQPPSIVLPPPVSPPVVATSKAYKLRAKTITLYMRKGRRLKNHHWAGSKRRTVFVKKYVVRTPKISGPVVKRVTVPRKGRWAPKRGTVKIKGTKLTYTLKKGVSPGTVKDRFHYTVTDAHGKKATGTVIVKHA